MVPGSGPKGWGSGFTLIELIVVITLISIMLSFTVPRFKKVVFSDDRTVLSRWITVKVPALKDKAVREQKRYILHVGFNPGRMWVTDASLTDEEIDLASENGFKVPDSFSLLDVEYMDERKISAGRADIHFYERGYSEKALIHIADDDQNPMTFIIEPFLTRVKLVNEYAGFEG